MLKKIERYIDHLSDRLDIENGCSDEGDVQRIISKYSAICAVTAMLPGYLIPGSDFVALTIIQCVMARNIAKSYGITPSFDEVKVLIQNVGMTLGLAFGAQQVVLSLYRTVVPYWGGVTTFGMVFSATYAIGYVIDKVYRSKVNGEDFCPSSMKEVLKDLKEEGHKFSQRYNPKKLLNIAKDSWNEVTSNEKDDVA